MRVHGETACDEIAHPGMVERRDDGVEAGEFHGRLLAALAPAIFPNTAPLVSPVPPG